MSARHQQQVSRQDRRPIRGVWRAALWLLVLGAAVLGQSGEAEPDHPFRFGQRDRADGNSPPAIGRNEQPQSRHGGRGAPCDQRSIEMTLEIDT